MAWYRFFVKLNSGKLETFRWLTGDDEEDVKSLFEKWATRKSRYEDGKLPILMGHEKVDTLPEKARAEMFEDVKARLRRDSFILDKLREDALKHPPEGQEMDVLNHEVTDAIFQAENLDHESARAWERVMKAEQAIAACSAPGVARSVAIDGVKTAKDKARKRREHR
jgi:hypothetical protein